MNANQRVKLPQNVRVSITRKLLQQNAGFVGQLRAIQFHGTIVIVMPSKDLQVHRSTSSTGSLNVMLMLRQITEIEGITQYLAVAISLGR